MVSRALGFVKAIVLAQTIGVVGSAGADAFGNAMQLPSNVYSIIAGGMINAVLVPQIVRAAKHDDGGQTYVNRLVTLSISLLGGITLIATVAAPVLSMLYGASLSSENLALVIAFAYWCLPQIFFYGLYAVLGEVLNARGLFGPFAWAPVINNVVSIGGLVAFTLLFGSHSNPPLGVAEWTPGMIAVLGGSATLGVAIQAFFLLFFWRRAGLRFGLDFQWKGTGLGQAGRLAGWTFGMLLVLQFTGLVETIVLNIAFGESAGVAATTNAYLLFVLPHGIIAVSIATATFTRMSEAASENRIDRLIEDYSGGVRLISMFLAFSMFGLMVLSPSLAHIFEADQAGTDIMALILCAFLLGTMPFSLLFLTQRVLYALEDTKTQFWLYLWTMPLHVFGMAVIALGPYDFIAIGLALMQSIMSALRFAVLAVIVQRRTGSLDGRRIARSLTKFFVAAVVAALVGLGLMFLLGAYTWDGFARSDRMPAILSCIVGGGVMAAVYVAILWFMRSTELLEALEPILRRFRRGSGPADGPGDGGADAGPVFDELGPVPGGAARPAADEPLGASLGTNAPFTDAEHDRPRHPALDFDLDAARAAAVEPTILVPFAPAGDEQASWLDEDERDAADAGVGAVAGIGAAAGSAAGTPWQSADEGEEARYAARDAAAYVGSVGGHDMMSDLSTTGIVLPFHPTTEVPVIGSTVARTRREQREQERIQQLRREIRTRREQRALEREAEERARAERYGLARPGAGGGTSAHGAGGARGSATGPIGTGPTGPAAGTGLGAPSATTHSSVPEPRPWARDAAGATRQVGGGAPESASASTPEASPRPSSDAGSTAGPGDEHGSGLLASWFGDDPDDAPRR